MASRTATSHDPTTKELPALGYPVSEDAVSHWFHQRYGRAPTEQELGAIISLMAEREETSPRTGPGAATQGWVSVPSAAPVTSR